VKDTIACALTALQALPVAWKQLLLAVAVAWATLPAFATPGVTADEIVLGQSVYLTGALAELGKDFTAGADAYFARVNAAGGVNGRRIRVVTLDDGYDPAKAVENAKALADQGVLAYWQFAGTGTVERVAALAEERQIPLIGAVATGPKLRSKVFPHTFYVRAGNGEELQAVVRHLATIGVQRVAVVYVDAPYGLEGLQAVQDEIRQQGRSLVATARIGVAGAGVQDAVATLVKSTPQATILVTVPASTKAFVLAARAAALNTQLYALNAALPVGVVHDLGEAAHGIVVCQVMPNVQRDSIPVVSEFRQAMTSRRYTHFTSAALEGFINAKVLVEGLRRAGRDVTRGGLVSALESINTFDLGGFVVHFSPTVHAGSKSVELSMIGADGSKFIY